MELLYFWINKSFNGILDNKQILLTDKYNINGIFNKNKVHIEISENNLFYNIFDNGIVKSISAIVGMNGCGKTTLLKYLYKNEIKPKYERYIKEYKESEKLNYEKNKGLKIFERDDKVIIIHNLEEDVVISGDIDKEIKIIDVNKEKYVDLEENLLTKLYLTNGNDVENGYSLIKGEPNKVSLVPNSISILSDNFYEKNITFTENAKQDDIEKDNLNLILQKIIISYRNEKDFQCICDILYFNKLIDKNKFESFSGKVCSELCLYSVFLPSILMDFIKRYYKDKCNISHKNINKKIKEWDKFLENINMNTFSIMSCLKLNWILELDFMCNILDDTFKNKLENLDINSIYTNIVNKFKKFSEKTYYDYYKNAIDEINILENIVKDLEVVCSPIPKGDLAYKEYILISYKDNKNKYEKFIKYIFNNVVKKEYSFVIKYIKFYNFGMSSGERAYLNFFSWINLLKFFSKLNSNFKVSLKDNVLLLIDEIDLFCHPEWQRKFIKFLIEELIDDFDYTKFQIIFATHSPIVLSDIPLSNTIYLSKNKNGTHTIDSRNKHKKTFAANIYELFNDSFFLEEQGVVGEYAKENINQIFVDLKKVIENKKQKKELNKKKIKFIINSIGEPLIKHKLEDMYWSVFSEDKSDFIYAQGEEIKKLKKIIDKSNDKKESELTVLSSQLKEILKSINELLENKGCDLK